MVDIPKNGRGCDQKKLKKNNDRTFEKITQ